MSPDADTPTGQGDLALFYEELCGRGREALRTGQIKPSLHLDDLSQDRRRGLTLIVRPSDKVAQALEERIGELKAAAPDLLFPYTRLQFHFTVLSLLNASETFEPADYVVAAFKKEIQPIVEKHLPFEVEFRGVCATDNSILAHGFPVGNGLEQLRKELRSKLGTVGLDAQLDQRYSIRGAHVTLARFKGNGDFRKLMELLEALRDVPLGTTDATRAELVCNDFYMSPEKVITFAVMPKPYTVMENVPPSFRSFVGRTAPITDTLRAVRSRERRVVVVRGLGGIGKSELAKKVAWECVHCGWPFRQVCWIDLGLYAGMKPASLASILNRIARAIDPQSNIPSITDLEQKKRLVAEGLKYQRTLLILDNYEDVWADRDEEQRLAEFIVRDLATKATEDQDDGFVRVLVTTRALHSLEPYQHECLELEKLPFAEAKELIQALQGLDPGKAGLLEPWQQRKLWEVIHGVPQLVILSVDMLRFMSWNEWLLIIKEKGADALFAHWWDHLASKELKQILMALTLFVGEAKADLLRSVSGVKDDAFWHELASISRAFIQNTGFAYTAHPLAMVFYRRQLEQNSSFQTATGARFVQHFSAFARQKTAEKDFAELETQIRNLAEAARLAGVLAEELPLTKAKKIREQLIELVNSTRDFLWIHGYWADYENMAQLAALAAEALGDLHSQACFLGCDLGWLALRREDPESAERLIQQALELFNRLGDLEHIALMKRHLGKATLLRGLDSTFYEPGTDWEENAAESGALYSESLDLREGLKKGGAGQDEAIADLKLDLGRLHWLEGQWLETQAQEQPTPALQEKALDNYTRAYAVSKEALKVYQELKSKRGLAKACGNCGNAARQMAKLCARKKDQKLARYWTNRARQMYTRSLELAHAISRKDEIAHAYWGLAETYLLCAELSPVTQDSQRQLLEIALLFADASHKLYQNLAGPRDVKSTRRLLDQIQGKLQAGLSRLPPAYGCKRSAD